jgi:hypothetical protein
VAVVSAACGSRDVPAPEQPITAICRQRPLHYHIAIDRSGSLDLVWKETTAKDSLAAAARSIPPGAFLHLYTFAETVQEHRPWQVDAQRLPAVQDSVRAAMESDLGELDTHIYQAAFVLARRIQDRPDADHVVFFVSDEIHHPRGKPGASRGEAQRAWDSLQSRIRAGTLRVVSVRVGDDPASTFSNLVGITAGAAGIGIPQVGPKIAEGIANDSFATERQRERNHALVTATLDPARQEVGFPGGSVSVRLASTAQCGVYRLDDGTLIQASDTVVRRELSSALSVLAWLTRDSVLLRTAGEAFGEEDLPHVTEYIALDSASTSDTAYARGDLPVQVTSGEIVFTTASLGVRLAVLGIGLFLLGLIGWLVLLPRLPAKGGSLRTTRELAPANHEIGLAQARRGRWITVRPPEPPRVEVSIERTSWWNRKRKKLLVRVLEAGPVSIAMRRGNAGRFVLHRVEERKTGALTDDGFIVWPDASAFEESELITRGMLLDEAGYEWEA